MTITNLIDASYCTEAAQLARNLEMRMLVNNSAMKFVPTKFEIPIKVLERFDDTPALLNTVEEK